MGVRTTADERIDKAQQAIIEAQDALGDVIFHKVWGSHEYKPEFEEFMNKLHEKLSKWRRKFNEWRSEN